MPTIKDIVPDFNLCKKAIDMGIEIPSAIYWDIGLSEDEPALMLTQLHGEPNYYDYYDRFKISGDIRVLFPAPTSSEIILPIGFNTCPFNAMDGSRQYMAFDYDDCILAPSDDGYGYAICDPKEANARLRTLMELERRNHLAGGEFI